MTTADLPAPAPAAEDKSNPTRSPIYKVGKRLRPWFNRMIAGSSIVSNAPVLDRTDFPWMLELEKAYPAIRAEAEALLAERDTLPVLRDVSPDHKRIADGRWRSYFLWGYGFTIDSHLKRCPATAKAVEGVPGLNSAFFSILEPGSRIPAHKGVTKRLMTAHLGLIVPPATPGTEGVRMRVADQTVRWTEGKFIVFDDTYEHEVWNDTDGTRVVLLVQFKRPLRQPGLFWGELFLQGVRHSPFVREARRNMEAWDQAMTKLDYKD